jgi:DNA segregation ATPase FtsK/SpoIIIE-like protein
LETGVELVRQIRDTMMERYTIMEDAGVNNFINLKDENGQMPKAILLMIDEAYMFLAPEGAKTDEGKQRDQWHGEAVTMLGEILRLGRASGIFMVMATQRPDASVIPGEMRANMDVRIAAGRMDSTPSSMILDSGAATLLPGHIKGRGALRSLGEISQFQGYFAEEEWIKEWLENNKAREPELFGLPDVEDQSAGAEEAMDFVPDAQLQFEMDREMEELLAGDTKPDYNGKVVDGNNLPEGPGEDYVRTRIDPAVVSQEERQQEEAAVLHAPEVTPLAPNPFMLEGESNDAPVIATPPPSVPAPVTPIVKPSLPPRPQRPAFPTRPKFPGAGS